MSDLGKSRRDVAGIFELDESPKPILPFRDFNSLPNEDVFERLPQSTGPQDIQTVDALFAAEPQMDDLRIGAAKSVAAVDPFVDFVFAGKGGDFRSNGIAIGAGSDQSNLER